MSDELKKRPRAWIGWALIAALLFYPLSMGPGLWVAFKMTEEFDNPHIAHSAIKAYEPLMAAARTVGASRLLQGYVNWFVSFGWGWDP
jgi:hypothetical protein